MYFIPHFFKGLEIKNISGAEVRRFPADRQHAHSQLALKDEVLLDLDMLETHVEQHHLSFDESEKYDRKNCASVLLT